MKKILYFTSFLVKSWEVSILLLLPFIHLQQQITVVQIGLLGATMSVFQVCCNLFAGHLTEKLGNKKVIIFVFIVLTFAWLLVSVQNNIVFLFIVYALAGIGSGIFNPVVNAMIAHMHDENRGREMGNFSAFTDMGKIIATTVTTSLVTTSYKFLTLAYATITGLVVFLLLGWKFTAVHISNPTDKKITFLSLIKHKKYVFSVLTGMFDSFSSSSLYIFIPLLLIPKGIAFATTGILTSLFFAGYMLGRLILGRFADKHGYATILIPAEILMGIFILLLIFAQQIILIGVIIFILGIFTRGTSPVIRAMVAEAVEEKAKFNKAYSLFSFSVNSSSILSRSIFGFIAASFGINSVFYLASFVALGAIVPIIFYGKRHQNL